MMAPSVDGAAQYDIGSTTKVPEAVILSLTNAFVFVFMVMLLLLARVLEGNRMMEQYDW